MNGMRRKDAAMKNDAGIKKKKGVAKNNNFYILTINTHEKTSSSFGLFRNAFYANGTKNNQNF